MRRLKISISPEGEVSVQVEGVAGASCVDDTKFLEDALGGAVKTRELTAEFYQEADTKVEVGS